MYSSGIFSFPDRLPSLFLSLHLLIHLAFSLNAPFYLFPPWSLDLSFFPYASPFLSSNPLISPTVFIMASFSPCNFHQFPQFFLSTSTARIPLIFPLKFAFPSSTFFEVLASSPSRFLYLSLEFIFYLSISLAIFLSFPLHFSLNTSHFP